MSDTYLSIADLQAMTRADFLVTFPQVSRRWRAKGHLVCRDKVLKAIIRAAAKMDWSQAEKRGPREFWYNPVKPILSEAIGIDRASHPHSNNRMIELLSDMVKAGELAYSDLGIVDFKTLRENYEQIDKAECWKNVLLFVEKDAAYVHLRTLKELLNITLVSGGGWSNTSSIEALINTLSKQGTQDVHIFTLTDYDPFGYAIDCEFTEKCRSLGFNVLTHHRIGINPDHVPLEHISTQKYPIKPDRKLKVNGKRFDSNDWLLNKGIEGKYGLEIEAVSGQMGGPQELRKIVVTELLKHLDEWDRVNEITNIAWKKAPIEAVKNLLYRIDRGRTGDHQITGDTKELPESYLSWEQYQEQLTPLTQERDELVSDLDEEIADLESQLWELNNHREREAAPITRKIDVLTEQYERSRDVLAVALYKQYNNHKDEWPRENYTLGYPRGCVIESVIKKLTLAEFLNKVNNEKIVNDIHKKLETDHNNDIITPIITAIINGEVS